LGLPHAMVPEDAGWLKVALCRNSIQFSGQAE
jgi:hypothetical protein